MIIRVTEPGRPAFQLRKGEEGLSVFDSEAVDPPLTEAEVVASFRAGSLAVVRSREDVASKGLRLVPVEGMASLPLRLREAHAEIRPGETMLRPQFKQALRELE
jgi:hypothetical protein